MSGASSKPTSDDKEWDDLVRDEPKRTWAGGGIPHLTPSKKKRRAEWLARQEKKEVKPLFG